MGQTVNNKESDMSGALLGGGTVSHTASPVGGDGISFPTLAGKCLSRGHHVLLDPNSTHMHQWSNVASLIQDQSQNSFPMEPEGWSRLSHVEKNKDRNRDCGGPDGLCCYDPVIRTCFVALFFYVKEAVIYVSDGFVDLLSLHRLLWIICPRIFI